MIGQPLYCSPYCLLLLRQLRYALARVSTYSMTVASIHFPDRSKLHLERDFCQKTLLFFQLRHQQPRDNTTAILHIQTETSPNTCSAYQNLNTNSRRRRRRRLHSLTMPPLSGPIDFGSKRSEQSTLKRKAERQDSRAGTNQPKHRKIALLKKAPTQTQQYGVDLDHEDFQGVADDIIENDLAAEESSRMELMRQVGYENDVDVALDAGLFDDDDPDVEAARAKLLAVKQKEANRTQRECNKILHNLRQAPKHFSYANNHAVQPVKKPIGLALPPKSIASSKNASLVKHESGPSSTSRQPNMSNAIPTDKSDFAASTNKDPRLTNPDYFAAPDVLGVRPGTVSSVNSILSGYKGRIANPAPPGAILPNPTTVWQKNDAKRRQETKNFIPPPHYAPYQISENANLRRYDLQNNSKEIPFNKEVIHANKNGNVDHYDLQVLKAWLRIQGQPTTGTKIHIEGAIDIFLSEHGSELDDRYGTAAMAEKKYVAKKVKVETKQKPVTPLAVASASAPTMTSTPPASVLTASPQTAPTERSLPPAAAMEDAVHANNAAKWDEPLLTVPSMAKAGTPSAKAVVQAIQRNNLGSFSAPSLREFARFVLDAREATSKDKKEQSIHHIIMWYGYIKKKVWFAEVYGEEVCRGPGARSAAANGRGQNGDAAGGYRPKSPVLANRSGLEVVAVLLVSLLPSGVWNLYLAGPNDKRFRAAFRLSLTTVFTSRIASVALLCFLERSTSKSPSCLCLRTLSKYCDARVILVSGLAVVFGVLHDRTGFHQHLVNPYVALTTERIVLEYLQRRMNSRRSVGMKRTQQRKTIHSTPRYFSEAFNFLCSIHAKCNPFVVRSRNMQRPQKRAKTSRTRATIEAATSAARARNEAAAAIKTTTPAGEGAIAMYEYTLLSKIYADSNINPLSASLVMQRSDVGEDTCRLGGYVRGSQHSENFQHRVCTIAKNLLQGEIGGRIPQKLIDETNAMFTRFALSTFIPSQGRHAEIEAYTYGQLVEFFCDAIEVRTATVYQHPDGETEVHCVIEEADVFDVQFEQEQATQDQLTYITFRRTQAETARAKAEADAAEDAKNRQKSSEMSEVAVHLESLKKNPIPYHDKRFTARGIAAFGTIKALGICLPTMQLKITRSNTGAITAEATGYSNAKHYCDELRNRVDGTLTNAGVTPISDRNGVPRFGVSPLKISYTATCYGKEAKMMLGQLHELTPTREHDGQVRALVSVSHTGFLTVSIRNLVLPEDFYRIVKGAITKVYRETEGALEPDEKEYCRKMEEATRKRRDAEEEEEMAKALELELEQEMSMDVAKAGEGRPDEMAGAVGQEEDKSGALEMNGQAEEGCAQGSAEMMGMCDRYSLDDEVCDTDDLQDGMVKSVFSPVGFRTSQAESGHGAMQSVDRAIRAFMKQQYLPGEYKGCLDTQMPAICGSKWVARENGAREDLNSRWGFPCNYVDPAKTLFPHIISLNFRASRISR
ncbi:uncharacterized protein MYCFIDRAFT_176294 [Pseudocercospora fijiensis CIRAD86]|uniref:Uncharacterized protein n=1 Tax=Pseudocercospora fijiensis (strain CIRAD86) TaxID=383855 RepID=M3ATX8_PSEFD|nr:uncharacterized protein MYCFIDRAFT_176294 [Pseudocercospora fijiensis CIRAD86]EME80942.1 hypothetical protein MYCFIDRAFT_176294 [Pseudocercospora fijiensis CIRAD86]